MAECANPECTSGKPIMAGGLCQGCYWRKRRNGSVDRKRLPNAPGSKCGVEGCVRMSHARGLCSTHYQQQADRARAMWRLMRNRHKGEFPPAWNSFEAFVEAVGAKPGEKYQLRRIRPEEPWSASNAVWREPVRVGGKTGLTANMADYQRAYSYLRKFGLREGDIARMRADQGDNCGVCSKPLEALHADTGKPIRICVDHDHLTNAVRGLLHDHCNKLLGHANDDIALLRGAIAYLAYHQKAVPHG
jgi:hypothetical protein